MKNKADLIAFEKRIADLYDAGELPYLVHLSGGNEDQLIEIFKEVKPDDWVFSTHRNHYHYLLHGGYAEDLEAKILAGKSMFIFSRARNFFASSIVAATPAIAAGVAWAIKRQGSSRRVWCFVGDGAEDEGHFYEAARYADGMGLPCTFIIEDNDRNVTAPRAVRRGTDADYAWPDCVKRYHYAATYPHGGSGSGAWLKFKREANVISPPARQDSMIKNVPHIDIKYLDAVREISESMAAEGAVFIGYNAKYGGAYGSLKNVPCDQKLETPLAENLMIGLGMGMSLEGIRPVVFFERHEFLLNAMDGIVNTLDVIDTISGGEFRMPVIIKAVAGSVKPFYAGLTHTRNMAAQVREFVSFPVYEPQTGAEVLAAYDQAWDATGPVMVSEKKELY